MCNLDYDSPDFYNEEIVTAKKNHICIECNRIIYAKEKYQYASGKWEGEFSTFKTCSGCILAQEFLQKECGGWVFGMLYDDIFCHAENYKKISLYRIVVGMKRKWKKFKSDDLMQFIIKEIK